MQIDCTCNKCKKSFSIDPPNICGTCFFQRVGKSVKKAVFWQDAKRFAYAVLFYVPIAVFINLRFGFWYEMAFCFGMVWLCLITELINWLMRKF